MAEDIGIFIEDGGKDVLIDEKSFEQYISRDIKRNIKVKLRGVELNVLDSSVTENGEIITGKGEKITITEFYDIAYGQTPQVIVDGVPIAEPKPPSLLEAYKLFEPEAISPQLQEYDNRAAEKFYENKEVQAAQKRLESIKTMQDANLEQPSKTPPADAKTFSVDGQTGESFTFKERNDLAENKGFNDFKTELNQTINDINDRIKDLEKNGTLRSSLKPEDFGFKHLSIKAFSKLIDGVSYLFEKFTKLIPYGVLVGLIYEVTLAHQNAINGCYLLKTDPKSGVQTQQKIQLLTCGDAKSDTVTSVTLLNTCQTIDYSPSNTSIPDCTGNFNPCANPNNTTIFNRGKNETPVPPYVPNVCNYYYAEQEPSAPVKDVTVQAPTCTPQDKYTSKYCDTDNFFLLPGESLKSVNMDFWSSLTDLALGIGSDIVNPLLKLAEGVLEGPGNAFGAALKKFLIILAIVVVVGLLIFWILGLLKKKAEKSFLG